MLNKFSLYQLLSRYIILSKQVNESSSQTKSLTHQPGIKKMFSINADIKKPQGILIKQATMVDYQKM